MGEEFRAQFEKRISELLEEVQQLELGSEEHKAAVEEIDRLTKLINDDFRNQQAAFDQDEARRIDESDREKRQKNETLKSVLDFTKSVLGIAGSFFGVKQIYKLLLKLEQGGVIPNRELMRQLPGFFKKLF